MKYFQTLATLENRLKKGIAWDDSDQITVGNATRGRKVFKLYEYGGGSLYSMSHDYVYFVNKQTHDAIYIKYQCPSYQYKDGVKVQTKHYEFISMEYIENMDLWRIDTL